MRFSIPDGRVVSLDRCRGLPVFNAKPYFLDLILKNFTRLAPKSSFLCVCAFSDTERDGDGHREVYHGAKLYGDSVNFFR